MNTNDAVAVLRVSAALLLILTIGFGISGFTKAGFASAIFGLLLAQAAKPSEQEDNE